MVRKYKNIVNLQIALYFYILLSFIYIFEIYSNVLYKSQISEDILKKNIPKIIRENILRKTNDNFQNKEEITIQTFLSFLFC